MQTQTTHDASAAHKTVITPYNPKNTVLDKAFLESLLREYGVDLHRHPVRDIDLYRKALTHRSYCTRKNENFLEGNAGHPPDCVPLQEESYERHEFLGDAVLNLTVAAYLVRRYPDENEGFMTRLRTRLVNGNMLARLCAKTGLARYIIISRQIEDNDGRHNKNILEDCFEAFLGALFCDAGFDAAQAWLVSFLEKNVDFPALIMHHDNYKDTLSKYFQHAFNCMPRFVELPSRGGGASRRVEVCLKNPDGVVVGRGVGSNRKNAEVEASRVGLMYYGQAV